MIPQLSAPSPTWRLVRLPTGHFAIFVPEIHDYTQYDLTEATAYETCRHEYGMSPAEAAATIQAAIDTPRFWYETERNIPVHETDWLDLQRNDYNSTPSLLRRHAIAQRDERIRELNQEAARATRHDWFLHAASGLTFIPTDEAWPAIARLADAHDFPVVENETIFLKIDPYKSTGTWKLLSGSREGYVRQEDVVATFAATPCGAVGVSDRPSPDPGPCIKTAGHDRDFDDVHFDGQTYFGTRTAVRTAGFGDA